MTALEIRPLAPADRAAWGALWADYLDFYAAQVAPDLPDLTFARYVDPARRDMRAWLALRAGRALGLAHVIIHPHGWTAEDVTYLQDLFTAPQARGQGVARALIDTVYADADAAGRGAVYWMTDRGNTVARALYDKIARPTEFMKYARRTP